MVKAMRFFTIQMGFLGGWCLSFTEWVFHYRMLNVFLNLLLVNRVHIQPKIVKPLHLTSRSPIEFRIRHRHRSRPTPQRNTKNRSKSES